MNSLHEPTIINYGYAGDMIPTEALSPRELDVLLLMAMGHDNKTIGRLLGIHWMTARSHVSNIIEKFGANNRTHVVHIAYQSGYLTPCEPQVLPTVQQAVTLAAHYAELAKTLMQEGR